MKRARPLCIESLESRQLLSTGRFAVGLAAPAALDPLVLDGSLRVDYSLQRSSLVKNFDGSLTRTVPVAGRLGAMGRVRGIWSESVDSYGNYDGPDTLVVGNSKGTVIVSFFNQNPAWAGTKRRRPTSFVHTQQVLMGSRAYEGATEIGTIVLTTRAEQTRPYSLTLHTSHV